MPKRIKISRIQCGDPRCPNGGVKLRIGKKVAHICNGAPGSSGIAIRGQQGPEGKQGIPGTSGTPGTPGAPGSMGTACGAGTLRRVSAISYPISIVCPTNTCTMLISPLTNPIVFDTQQSFGTVSPVGFSGLHVVAGETIVSATIFISVESFTSAQLVFIPDNPLSPPQLVNCTDTGFVSLFLFSPTNFRALEPGTFRIVACCQSPPCQTFVFPGSTFTVEQITC